MINSRRRDLRDAVNLSPERNEPIDGLPKERMVHRQYYLLYAHCGAVGGWRKISAAGADAVHRWAHCDDDLESADPFCRPARTTAEKPFAIALCAAFYILLGYLVVNFGWQLTQKVGDLIARIPALFETQIAPALWMLYDRIQGACARGGSGAGWRDQRDLQRNHAEHARLHH